MKVLQLAKTPDATETYRLVYPQTALELAGHEVRRMYLESWPKSGQHHPVRPVDVEWADLIHVQRPVSEFALKTIQQVKARYPRLPIVGDYDDDYYNVPKWNQGFTYVAAHSEWWPQVVPLLDGITFSTHPLKESFERNGWQGPSAVIQNAIDVDTICGLERKTDFAVDSPTLDKNGRLQVAYRIDAATFNELHKDKTVVAWAGSAFHYADIDQLAEALQAVAEADENVVFVFIGYTQGNVVKALPANRLFHVAGAFPIEEFYRRLKSLKIDISLAPLHPCAFNAAKSNLKLMEAFTLGWYPVATDIDPYFDDLDPDAEEYEGPLWMPRHGLLVDPNQPRVTWRNRIREAIDIVRSGDDRWRSENLAYVRDRYMIHDRVDDYDSFFSQIAEAKAQQGIVA